MDKDILKDAREDFKRAAEAESEQRKVSLDDLEFAKLGKQWPQEVEEKRRQEGRPCLTINRLPSFVKQVTNDARMNRPSITTKPVGDGSDKETARILNDLIRNIETQSSADIIYDTALDFAVVMGFGYFVIRTDYTCDDAFEQDIFMERVSNPFSVYGDPDSKEATSIDWNKAFIADWYSKSQFKRKWGDAEAASFELDGSDDATAMWFEDDKIRVAEYWTRDEVNVPLLKLSDGMVMHEPEYIKIKDLLDAQGVTVVSDRPGKSYKVKQRIVSGVDVLEENDWLGRYIPIVPMYGEEVNVNGKRHFLSLIRFAKDPQRMFNYWRTASTELVALAPKAPFIGAVGAFATDAAKWQTANTDTHAYIEYDPVPGEPPPQRQMFAGVPAGALQEALNASDDMKSIMGIFDASLGAKSNETSGRAIMARQREGDTSTFNFIDNRNRAVEHGGKIIVDLIPKIYTVPRIMRCIKEDGSVYNVPVNQPVIPQPTTQPGQPPEQFQQAEQMIEGVTKIFDLTAGKYDVSVVAGPSFTTKREEAANQMMEFIRVFPQSAPLIGDLLAKNLDWPGSEEIAARLKAMLPPQAAGQINPMVQQLQQMLQQQDGQAKQAVAQLQGQIAELQQQLKDKAAQEAIKAEELRIKEYEAQTDRIKVQGELEVKQTEGQLKAAELLRQPFSVAPIGPQ